MCISTTSNSRNPSPSIWSYGWCTTTLEILEDNFAHIQIEFTVNESPVPSANIAVIETSREDGSPCREFVALAETWTPGQHHLEIRVAFTQDIHDGWDLSPPGRICSSISSQWGCKSLVQVCPMNNLSV